MTDLPLDAAFFNKEFHIMLDRMLSQDTCKSLRSALGEQAALEIQQAFTLLLSEIESLQRNKVSVTRIVPSADLGDETLIVTVGDCLD
jgi:hypothetical protein